MLLVHCNSLNKFKLDTKNPTHNTSVLPTRVYKWQVVAAEATSRRRRRTGTRRLRSYPTGSRPQTPLPGWRNRPGLLWKRPAETWLSRPRQPRRSTAFAHSRSRVSALNGHVFTVTTRGDTQRCRCGVELPERSRPEEPEQSCCGFFFSARWH